MRLSGCVAIWWCREVMVRAPRPVTCCLFPLQSRACPPGNQDLRCGGVPCVSVTLVWGPRCKSDRSAPRSSQGDTQPFPSRLWHEERGTHGVVLPRGCALRCTAVTAGSDLPCVDVTQHELALEPAWGDDTLREPSVKPSHSGSQPRNVPRPGASTERKYCCSRSPSEVPPAHACPRLSDTSQSGTQASAHQRASLSFGLNGHILDSRTRRTDMAGCTLTMGVVSAGGDRPGFGADLSCDSGPRSKAWCMWPPAHAVEAMFRCPLPAGLARSMRTHSHSVHFGDSLGIRRCTSIPAPQARWAW